MTSTETIRVIPFDGKADNFKMWSRQFQAFAMKTRYIDVLNGKVKVPKESDVLDETIDSNKPLIAARKANVDITLT